jgi:hypothetical protein
MDKQEVVKIKDELEKRWACHDHDVPQTCFKPQEPPYCGKKCVALDDEQLLTWAGAIKLNLATYFRTPETPEFHSLIGDQNKAKRRGQTTVVSQNPLESIREMRAFATEIMALSRSGVSNGIQTVPATIDVQVPAAASRAAFCSPVRGVLHRDLYTEGLMSFLMWCSDKYDDQDYLDCYAALNDQKVGLQFFKGAIRDREKSKDLFELLTVHAGLKAGIAWCLISEFAEYYETL